MKQDNYNEYYDLIFSRLANMSDFNFVTSRLATGAAILTKEDADTLVKVGITHSINCAIELNYELQYSGYKVAPFYHIENGMADDGQPKPASWFDKSIRFSLMALAQPGNRVYIHCAAGINRGPSNLFAVLLALGLTPEESEKLIRNVRPQVGLVYKNDAINVVNLLNWR